MCAVDLPTKVFELIQNGWFLSQVRLETQVLSYRFSLGAITSNNSGIYRCRCGVEPPVDIHLPALNKWTMLSNAVEVTGKGKQGDNWENRWRSFDPPDLLSLCFSSILYQVDTFIWPLEACKW